MTKHIICDEADLPPGASRLATLGKLEVGVYNIDGSYVAVRNLCPHAGAPLCKGAVTGTITSDDSQERHWDLDGKILKCPWHGWEFILPEGTTLVEPAYKVMTFVAFAEHGKVVVDLAAIPVIASDTAVITK